MSASNPPSHIWVKLTGKSGGVDEVPTTGCSNIAQFSHAIKKHFAPKLDTFAAADLSVYINETDDEPLYRSYSLGLIEKNDEKYPLIVKLPSPTAPAVTPEPKPSFFDLLKKGRVDRPDRAVLSRIMSSFATRASFAAESKSPTLCVQLYTAVKEMPATTTRYIALHEASLIIDGPLSDQYDKILLACDARSGERLLLKVLPRGKAHKPLNDAEREACMNVEDIEGLVRYRFVDITPTTQQPTAAENTFQALISKRYVSSLALDFQLTENLIRSGFPRIFSALQKMHSIGLVHMDVKPENIFVTAEGTWDLGDFGSTRKIHERISSYTPDYHPFVFDGHVTVIPSMDFVCLCVTICHLQNKETWKERLFLPSAEIPSGQRRIPQSDRIRNELAKIEDDAFRIEMLELFNTHYEVVVQHINASQSV